MPSQCYWSVCFFHLSKDAPKFFGFSEYLAAVALMALAWTIADVRYKFRIATAPFPLQVTTYSVIGVIGVLTLLTDWWRAEQWLVPEGSLMTCARWQALLGFVFLTNFMVWAWFAFIKPPTYSKFNALRFAREVYKTVLRGSSAEMAEIADELARSAEALVRNAWQSCDADIADAMAPKSNKKPSRHYLTRQCATDILLLIADKKFCRQAVTSSPIIAIALFEETQLQGRYQIPLGTFARNFTAEAIANKDSFAFHETEGYYTGFIGYQKPITRSVYGSYNTVVQLDELFDIPYDEQRRWDAHQWEAFCRLLLSSIRDAAQNSISIEYQPAIAGAIESVGRSVNHLHKLNGTSLESWDSDEVKKLTVAVEFSIKFVEILNKHHEKLNITLRRSSDDHQRDICDAIAEFMFELIFNASAIKSPRDLCWSVQHNDVWSSFFNNSQMDGRAGNIVRFKLKRLLINQINEMNEFPNFRNSRILGLMLNVMGLKEHRHAYGKSTRSLHRLVIRWTVKNYARLAKVRPALAENALVDGLTYDRHLQQLVHVKKSLLDRKVEPIVLQLAPVPSES
ncbi:hypothetical protein [Burkholderia multivorans]|uniref:hypothetical protein n=1 Tax=Burkholderia multivorans TaxID=87883 RepID=UPI0009E0D000|nr:hypothetical protein [Burkholderia multivorans]SAK27459.1 hypothetical protein UA12_01101 [Burkholderia multivorans]